MVEKWGEVLREEIYLYGDKDANAGKQMKRKMEGKNRPSPGVGTRLASVVRRVGCGKTCTKYEGRELARGATTEGKVQRAIAT